MAQLAEQRSLIPMAQRVVAVVGKPDSIANEDVVVDVALESRPERLHRHDNARPGLFPLFLAVAVTPDLRGCPAGEDSMYQTADLAMQPGVQLEALAQAYLFGQAQLVGPTIRWR